MQCGEELLHAVDGPEEIDGGGRVPARRAQIFSNSGANSSVVAGLGMLCAEGDAVGCGDADGGRAADDHGDDDVGYLFVGVAST